MATPEATQPVPVEEPSAAPDAEDQAATGAAPAAQETAQPVADLAPDPNAILAAEIAARDEEVEQEITADLAGFAEAERVFLIEADAGIAAERQWAQTHNPLVLVAINSRCDDAGDIIHAMCSRHGIRRAA